ncbi:hypothetical protein KFK09_009971 [Dendrobium nobile]|uniref:Uncharacterized protein n=1 Tax=Dendrobium nobile TaxID=94219 RepID=A0A8T3BMJ0_DENNO|nr:hypothetical protein KFK09_009971 [Dendrobium nobile]
MAHRRVRAQPLSLLRRRPSVLLLALFSSLLFLAFLHICASVLRRANDLGRRCLANPSVFSGISTSAMTRTLKIAMVSLSLEEISDGVGRPTRRRSFRGVMAAVGGNKRAYAARMGYDFVDAHDLVDPGRPPSWSKIVAVRSQLPSHDWVFWNDADTVVTNPDISLENILGAVIGQADFETSPDLVVTEDVNGINAGVFFVRRSKWSENFLETWWNLTSFVQFGSTKSGDNDALKYLIRNLSSHELRSHVRISPMQCLFNSYPWYPSWKSVHQLIFSSGAVWRGVYSRGDFMVHLAGLDDKKEWADRIIQELEAQRRDYVYLTRQRPLYTP